MTNYTIQQDQAWFDEVFGIIRSSVSSCHNDICSVAYALISFTFAFYPLFLLLRIMRFVMLQAAKRNMKERLSEMAKEFGATSFEEASEETVSAEGKGMVLASKQHVKRLISGEQEAELDTYQGTLCIRI